VFPLEVGRFFGFCSELCGVNHRFMPIVVEVLNLNG
jgi:heme/copper-type cytochrome/quinol oxidase subunit 2